MELEQRIVRAERLLKMFARSGRKYRNEFRQSLNALIAMQMQDHEEWRARHQAMDEKINILINAQITTDEQMKKTDERIEALQAKTEQSLDRLAASQAKTDEALQRFLNGLSNGRSERFSD